MTQENYIDINDLEQSWEPTEEEKFLWELSRTYYIECERYDQTVCSRKDIYGIAYPANSHELAKVNIFARHKLQELEAQCEARGFTKRAFRQQRNRYETSHHCLEDMKQFLV